MKILAVVFLAAALTISGCKDDDPADPPETTTKTISVAVSNKVAGQPLELDTEYQLNGQTVMITDIKYFLSDFQLTDHDGNDIESEELGSHTILVTAEGGTYPIARTTADIIHNVDFAFGVDSEANHADPMLAEAPLDLSGEADGMHWAWATGYKFMRFEGMVDVDGTMQTFQYHIGDDEFYTETPIVHLDRDISGDAVLNVSLDVTNMLFGLEEDGIEAGMFHGPTHPLEFIAVENMAAGTAFTVQ